MQQLKQEQSRIELIESVPNGCAQNPNGFGCAQKRRTGNNGWYTSLHTVSQVNCCSCCCWCCFSLLLNSPFFLDAVAFVGGFVDVVDDVVVVVCFCDAAVVLYVVVDVFVVLVDVVVVVLLVTGPCLSAGRPSKAAPAGVGPTGGVKIKWVN